jgi:SAM-dependent methyltransferase
MDFLTKVLAAMLARLLADDVTTWLSSLREFFIKSAVSRLPRHARARYAEEWRAHVDEVPGEIGKTFCCAEFLLAAYRGRVNEGKAKLLATSASKRLLTLLRHFPIRKIAAICAAMIDDYHVRSFDRKYKVRTSGHIQLSDTSFDASKLNKATSYGPVNAWGFRKLLQILDLPRPSSFVDLGCGRACIIAAEYGFNKVTGVELAPELCKVARENVGSCPGNDGRKLPVEIIEGDVLDYCDRSQDDVYFTYRAFSLDFFREVLERLMHRAVVNKRPFTLIYTERLGWPQSPCVTALAEERTLRRVYEGSMFGQAFFVYRFEP